MVSAEQPGGVELLLEPSGHWVVPKFKQALREDIIAAASFEVAAIEREFWRVKSLGVEFVQEPTAAGTATVAAFDDTCGNLIQLMQRGEP